VKRENSLFVEQAGKPVLENGARCEFKSTIGFNQKIAIPRRLTGADTIAKFRQLINIHGRQSAIIIVTVTDDLPVQSGSKKPGYPSRLDPAAFYLFDAPKKLPQAR